MRGEVALALLTGVALLAVACQPLPHPFADEVPKPGSPMLALPDTAAVAVSPVRGGPRPTAERLAPAIAAALQNHDIAASDRAIGIASYRLDGRLQAMPPAGDKAAIVVLWELRDAAGKSLGNRAERVEAAAQDWQRGDGAAVKRLAEVSAEQIAAMLQGKAPAEAADSGKIRVAIGTVNGASGDGGTALSTAIASLLKKQDLAVLTDPRAAADLRLDATVAVGKPQAGKQHVRIVWVVRRKSGSEIGNVVQENDVPAGLLDGPWGDIAYTIALAAQDGVMQLIDRGAQRSAGDSQSSGS
jgi:hypothetical protein